MSLLKKECGLNTYVLLASSMDVLHRSTTHIHKDAVERWLASHADTQILGSYPESSNYVSVIVFDSHWGRDSDDMVILNPPTKCNCVWLALV